MRLLDVLWHYDALVARVPLHQWREEASDQCDECVCEYVQLEQMEQEAKARGRQVRPTRRRMINPCTHRERGEIESGTTYRRPYFNPKASDPHAVVALKADVDRAIDALPHLVRKLFHLRYRQGIPLEQVRHMLRRPWSDMMRCHDLHLSRMERQLGDWFPEARQDRPVVAA